MGVDRGDGRGAASGAVAPGDNRGVVPGPGVAPASVPASGPACTANDARVGPRRLWRLTAAQYRNTITAALGKAPPTSPPFDAVISSDRFSTRAQSYTMTDLEFRAALDGSESAASAFVTAVRASPPPCLAKGAGTPLADCAEGIAKSKGAILFRRPLAQEEATRYGRLAAENAAMLGEDEALALMFQRMLMSPHFLFRTEIGAGATDAAGLVRLTPHEVAAALAYSFTDAPPDAALAKLAETGGLSTPEQIHAVAQELTLRAIEAESVRRFFREFTHYDRAHEITKDAKDYPFHRPAQLEEETDLWMRDVLKAGARGGLMKALLTSTEGYVRPDTQPSYNLPAGKGSAPVKVMLPAGQRAGLLTQPSFLVALSKPTETEPVRRGRFVAESLLCQAIPEIPIGGVPPLPDMPGSTMRERLKVHVTSKDNCWTCHQFMDPYGLALETYDHVGRHRTLENNKPIDPSGTLSGAGVGSDGPFTGAIDLSQRLAGSPLVAACLVRHSFRYWMGRDELPGDGCTLRDAAGGFERNGGDYLAMVSALFGSRSFLYRTTK